MVNIFIGYDSRETIAFYVLAHSIQERSSLPVSITPLNLKHLKNIFNRPIHKLQSTEFSFSRFLVPHLSNYSGWSLFMDCDMLVMDDIADLWKLRDDNYAVQVVKHKHLPKESVKFLDQKQTAYEKKNWSSVMLFNNARCGSLTPDYVNKASGLELHQFKWLEDEKLIGEIPKSWNFLVGYDEPKVNISNAHFTSGGPYFSKYAECDFAQEWFLEKNKMLYAER